MSETSRSRVTITLGRTGQVVKRAGNESDSFSTDPYPVAGNQRSIRERLGNDVDSSNHFNNKRMRGETRTDSTIDDVHLRKDDLRHKIMRKKQSESMKHRGGDLRNILSRPAQSSENSLVKREETPEPMDTRRPYLEPTDPYQQHSSHSRGVSPFVPVTRNSNQNTYEYMLPKKPDPRDQLMHNSRETGRRIPQLDDGRTRLPDPNSFRTNTIAHRPGPRATNAMPRVESGFDPYSPWTLDKLRSRSPDKPVPTSRGLSGATRDEDLRRRFAVRTYEDTKPSSYVNKDALELSRPMNSSYMTKVAPPILPAKTMTPMNAAPLPLPTGLAAQKSLYAVDDRVTVDSFLRSLGLERYAILFKVEEVDIYSLKRMTEIDLKELGLPMGPRKKILLSLQPCLRPQV